MTHVLLADYDEDGFKLELRMLADAGMTSTVESGHTTEAIIAAAGDASVILAVDTPLTRALFEALPKLRLISFPSIGVDTIDLEAAREHGVWVSNVPTANITEVATHALGMTLAMVRHLPFYDRDTRAGSWDYQAPGPLRRPGTLTLGIAGLGNIGRIFARFAAPIFGRIVGYDPYVPADHWPDGIERADDLAGLIGQADALSLHMPLTDQNHNLINAETLAAMKPGAYLINVSRGGLVDLDALLAALDAGHLAGAALDVFPEEPMPAGHALFSHPRTLLSPHAAFYSLEADEDLRRGSVENIIAWQRNGRPNHVVLEGKPG